MLIELPFPGREHPEAERIEAHTRQWARRSGLVHGEATARALAHSRFGEFAARAYPYAPLREAELAADWLAWLFFADDQYEEGAYGTAQAWATPTDAVRQVLEFGHAPSPLAGAPLIRALADLSRRFDSLASPVWKQRLTRHLLETMTSVFGEIQARDRGTPLPLHDYIALRRDCSGVLPSFDLIEICAQTEIPAEVYHSETYQDVVLAGVDVVAWTNDLYSLDKEIACGIMSNLVLVLRHDRGIGREQAFTAARALIDGRVRDLLAAERRLPELADDLRLDSADRDAVLRCSAGLRDWVAGSNQWHDDGTRRYRQPPGADPVEDLLNPATR